MHVANGPYHIIVLQYKIIVVLDAADCFTKTSREEIGSI